MSSLWGLKEARKSQENQVERKGSQRTNVNAGIAGTSYIAVIFILTGFFAIFTPLASFNPCPTLPSPTWRGCAAGRHLFPCRQLCDMPAVVMES